MKTFFLKNNKKKLNYLKTGLLIPQTTKAKKFAEGSCTVLLKQLFLYDLRKVLCAACLHCLARFWVNQTCSIFNYLN